MRILLIILLLANCNTSFSQTDNALKSCFSNSIPNQENEFDTELFVLVDQTTLFNNELKQSVADSIKPFVKPGNGVSVLKFSAYKMGQYTDVLASVKLDAKISQTLRDDISKTDLVKYDRCMKFQPKRATVFIGNALKTVFSGESGRLDKSDVLYSLKAASLKVKRSEAKRKIVLIASDMLENSSISSFYNRQTVRKIDPEKEMAIVEKNNLFGDFGNVEIYVIGAGLLPEDAKKSDSAYRPYQVMRALSTFWQAWFEKSNAKLIEFGQPALLNPIK